ncbi:hypothetical protein B484DRAFT_459025 [Ochromonadaceae sp. CCMP2298]|nr:hypothetical protein B484DRAFT_459025 [Ochromonadaceae sp. CCMP2298]|mmetsp:Transcript_23168/g.51471  ORF Transcript_23168/g.51471 Transcript_23168/m.51471 type:complete len:176 (+) Transcript_23168:109-636(+)|eukprot:CAMPEP_0173186720 /NCGR_PEP_ID=MMETSP1141-20130122/10298_1 /TAXON_ID=483371 /ORGANISM="non described non described, Strain CCMP2298" /LENGTH=175 /DNA_ID=CAMNT_0014110453 /DNA_START=100 /DNA_END=627 /DNA_ORIENTATION=+
MYSEDTDRREDRVTNETKSSRTVRVDRSDRPDVIQQAMPVPFYKIGWIVGRRGSYITQLTRKSGANISISDSESREYGTVWKYIMIAGTGREVDRAKKLLHIRLERFVPRTSQEIAAMQAASDASEDIPNGYGGNGNNNNGNNGNNNGGGGGSSHPSSPEGRSNGNGRSNGGGFP